MTDTQVSEFRVHVRFDGRSYEFSSTDLDLGNLSSDQDITERIAQELGIDVGQLSNYVVDRAETGNVTLRPQAVFGALFDIIRTDAEIEEAYNKASDAVNSGSRYPGMSYEEGWRDAITWLTDQTLDIEEML